MKNWYRILRHFLFLPDCAQAIPSASDVALQDRSVPSERPRKICRMPRRKWL